VGRSEPHGILRFAAQPHVTQAELCFWSDYNLIEPVFCSREAIEESSRVVSVRCITAKDFLIELTLGYHPECSLSNVSDELGLSRERAQFIMRRIAAKMAAGGATLVNRGSSRLQWIGGCIFGTHERPLNQSWAAPAGEPGAQFRR
jgi:hypothetical protein